MQITKIKQLIDSELSKLFFILALFSPLFAFSQSEGKVIFFDNFSGDWRQKWFLDGEQAELQNTPNGLIFSAGATPASDAAHSVLWTKRNFADDLQIEFDFVKRDTLTKFVNIVYLFACGSGAGEYKKDIFLWKDLRRIPAMSLYYNHINAFHISFAAYENDNSDTTKDYIRARLYRPESGKGLAGTEILPEHLQTGLFVKDVKYHFTIKRIGAEILLTVSGGGKTLTVKWILPDDNKLTSGRIGLRVMGGRVSEFGEFKVFALNY
jgi:hypothetical protein